MSTKKNQLTPVQICNLVENKLSISPEEIEILVNGYRILQNIIIDPVQTVGNIPGARLDWIPVSEEYRNKKSLKNKTLIVQLSVEDANRLGCGFAVVCKDKNNELCIAYGSGNQWISYGNSWLDFPKLEQEFITEHTKSDCLQFENSNKSFIADLIDQGLLNATVNSTIDNECSSDKTNTSLFYYVTESKDTNSKEIEKYPGCFHGFYTDQEKIRINSQHTELAIDWKRVDADFEITDKPFVAIIVWMDYSFFVEIYKSEKDAILHLSDEPWTPWPGDYAGVFYVQPGEVFHLSSTELRNSEAPSVIYFNDFQEQASKNKILK